jgi:hypothetical protein
VELQLSCWEAIDKGKNIYYNDLLGWIFMKVLVGWKLNCTDIAICRDNDENHKHSVLNS